MELSMLKEWQKRTDAGFSLIEILISVVILGILSAIVTVSVTGALWSANVKQCKTDFSTVSLATTAWLNDNTNADGTVDFSSWTSSTASVRYSTNLYVTADASGYKTLAGLGYMQTLPAIGSGSRYQLGWAWDTANKTPVVSVYSPTTTSVRYGSTNTLLDCESIPR
jgi:prepilin-type N-terminal cleavage/methylation domain-containing protein